ncbi:hypothetical protein V1515DRAFT_602105 [Lipomyces mesembrius]
MWFLLLYLVADVIANYTSRNTFGSQIQSPTAYIPSTSSSIAPPASPYSLHGYTNIYSSLIMLLSRVLCFMSMSVNLSHCVLQ